MAPLGELAGTPQLGRAFQLFSHPQVALSEACLAAALAIGGAVLGIVGKVGAPGGYHSAERGGAFEGDGKVAVERTGQDCVAEGRNFARTGRFGNAGHCRGDLGDEMTGGEQAGCLDTVSVYPGS